MTQTAMLRGIDYQSATGEGLDLFISVHFPHHRDYYQCCGRVGRNNEDYNIYTDISDGLLDIERFADYSGKIRQKVNSLNIDDFPKVEDALLNQMSPISRT